MIDCRQAYLFLRNFALPVVVPWSAGVVETLSRWFPADPAWKREAPPEGEPAGEFLPTLSKFLDVDCHTRIRVSTEVPLLFSMNLLTFTISKLKRKNVWLITGFKLPSYKEKKRFKLPS